MQEFGIGQEHLELKQLVAEASRALALLDSGRLEELALSCQALNRDLSKREFVDREPMARQAREAAGEMAALARVLDVTRGNLEVMNRLRELRTGRLEYFAPRSSEWPPSGSGHGNN